MNNTGYKRYKIQTPCYSANNAARNKIGFVSFKLN